MTTTETAPAMWDHTLNVFNAMKGQVEEEPYEFNGREFPLYKGFLSNLMFEDLGIPVPYYGRIMKTLTRMKCVQQVKRGGGPSPSEWVIIGEPTLESFMRVHAEFPEQSAKATRNAQLSQQIQDIRKNIGGVDVQKALADIAQAVEVLRGDFEEHLLNQHDDVA